MKLIKNESGATMVILAVFLGAVALGFLAVSLDTGLLFREKRMAQSAADAAALAAATEVAAGDTTNEQSVANAIAKLNGFDTTLATNPATVSLSNVTWNGNSNYVQATVSQPIKTHFLGVFTHNLSGVNVSATSIAGGSNSSSTCVCLENPTGEDLYLYGAAKILAPTCGIVDDSNATDAVVVTGGANLTALSLGTVSTSWDTPANFTNGGTITHTVTGISPGCSPTMPTPPTYTPANCVALGGTASAFTATPGCYTNLLIGYNNTLDTINPGVYIITGDLTFQAGSGGVGNLGGQGVFFYLTSTALLTISNGANINLVAGGSLESDGKTTAPSTGYNGILFYQATGNTNQIQVQGGSTTYLNGSILAPSANIVLNNGSANMVNGGIVAQTLTMYGGATLNATANTNEGSLNISSPKVVQ